MTWQSRSACRPTDWHLMTDPGILNDPAGQAAALRICRDCPVTQECGQWAASEPFTGVAGGRVFANGQPLSRNHVYHRRYYQQRKEAAS